MANPHHYRIVPSNPAAHLFEVSVTVDKPDPAGQAFAIPAWVPGSYMIRDLSRHVVSIRAVCDGEDIPLVKTDKSTWLAGPCDAPLTLVAEIYAYDMNVRGAHLDQTHGFFDGASVFPGVVGQEDLACEVDIAPPPGNVGSDWRVATSMRAIDAGQYEFGKYRCEDYAELIDHPVEMGQLLIGEFEACGIPHVIAVRGHARFDMARICHDLARLCETQLQFLGQPADLDRYVFLLTVKEQGYGGLEHCWSSALISSRKDLPRRGVDKVTDDYRKFLGLCSHEYFHLWNVKRMKPERFIPYDLRTETHTGLLWVFEGVTSYYDDLLLARSGLITMDSYLELLGKAITNVHRRPGRHRQTIEESSFDAWTKLYKQDANSPNAMISYYSKGSLVALALDMTLRKETNGQCSLDDVVHECWARYGESGEGMPERGIESVARSVSGLELEDFFDRFVRGTAELPLQGLLRTVGIDLHWRQSIDGKDAGGKPAGNSASPSPWIGASLDLSGSQSLFGTVRSGSPAELAGIASGDEAVAMDGLKLTAHNLDARLRDHHEGDTVVVTVFRDQQLMRHRVKLGTAPEDTCYLEPNKEAGEFAISQQDQWLGRRPLQT